MTEKYLTNQRFTDFNLDPAILKGLEEAGFEYCTPIQAESLPHLLNGLDVAGQAKTGTGKTAAFLVALFQHLITHPAPESRKDTQPRALVLAPTRELAIQIDKDARSLGSHLDLRLRLIYGGTGYESQRRELQSGVDVLIGTPGRIIDYFKQGVFSLDALQVMVLDEADRMFDLGFIKDIRYLFRRMPHPTERLSMLFSATLSLRVNELAYEHMNNPRVVKIESDKVTVDQVTQRVYFPANEDKLPLLLGLLRDAGDVRTVVFINTKHQSERVADALQASGVSAGVLSGDVPQKKRERLLDRFKAGEVNVLVATDVAARGLHIPDVSLVVNYDLPQDAEDYVHRIGRTARAGAAGDAISFACETYAFSLPEIEGFIGHKIDPASYNKDMLVQPTVDESSKRRSRKRDERRGAGGERRKSGRGKAERSGRSASDQSDKEKAEQAAGHPEEAFDSGAPQPERDASEAVPPQNAGAVRDDAPSEPAQDDQLATKKPPEKQPREEREAQPSSGQSAADEPAGTGRSSSGRPKHHRPGRRDHEIPAVG